VEVNDKMQKGYQKGYVYFRTKAMGRPFRLGFTAELTPRQLPELEVFGRKHRADCWKEFSGGLVQAREAFSRFTARVAELFWRERVAFFRDSQFFLV
jgi:hypothetical protein